MFLNDYEYLPRPYDMIQMQNLSHMLFVIALRFVQLLWPLLRFLSCAHDQDTRTPTNKLLTLTLRVTQKRAYSVHQIITPLVYHESLFLKFHMPKRKVWAVLKKEKKNIHAKEAWEKKFMPNCMNKRKKRERSEDSPYFQIKRIHPKRERFMTKGVQKII